MPGVLDMLASGRRSETEDEGPGEGGGVTGGGIQDGEVGGGEGRDGGGGEV